MNKLLIVHYFVKKTQNCIENHIVYTIRIVLAISEPTYSKKQLAALKSRDAENIEFKGKIYTRYEATQVQRQLETAARHAKDRQIIAKAAAHAHRTGQGRRNYP